MNLDPFQRYDDPAIWKALDEVSSQITVDVKDDAIHG